MEVYSDHGRVFLSAIPVIQQRKNGFRIVQQILDELSRLVPVYDQIVWTACLLKGTPSERGYM